MAAPIDYPKHNHYEQKDFPNKPNLLVSSIRPEQLFAMHQVSANAVQETITHGTGFPKYPTYSSNEEWIIFSSENEGKTSLYFRPAKDPKAEPQRLTDGEAYEGQATVHNDTIYFTSSEARTLDIYKARFVPGQTIRMRDAVNLTKGQGSNFSPSISPDGKWLAFTSNRHSTDTYPGPIPANNYKAGNVYIMREDGSEAQMISSGKSIWQGGPAWSKDGQALVYYAEEGENILLYRFDLEKKTVSRVGPETGKSLFPTYNPATGHLVFAHQKAADKQAADKHWKIKYMDEKNLKKLFSLKDQDCWAPSFKRDGSFIVSATTPTQGPYIIEKANHRDFHVTTGRGYFQVKEGDNIYSVEEMSHITLTTPKGSETLFKPDSAVFGLSKSPQCPWLATTLGAPFQDGMVKQAYSPAHIYKIPLDGSAPINLTEQLPGRNVWPTVSPDGRHIVFVHQKEGDKNKQLYIMDADGKNFKALTNKEGVHTMPSFSPDGKKIVFNYKTQHLSYPVMVLHLKDDLTPGHIEARTEPGHADTHPSYAPDNQTIAFSSDRGQYNEEFPYTRMFFSPQPYGDVYIQRHNKAIERVTNTPYEQATPTWQQS